VINVRNHHVDVERLVNEHLCIQMCIFIQNLLLSLHNFLRVDGVLPIACLYPVIAFMFFLLFPSSVAITE